MITIHELLEDPTYKEYFCKVPKLPVRPASGTPWVLYVQLKGETRWRRKYFAKYTEAFAYFRQLLKQGRVHDAAINCKSIAHPPPMRFVRIKGKYIVGSDNVRRQAKKQIEWKPKLVDQFEEHRWCPYCRRPTTFKWFSKHHAFKGRFPAGVDVDASVLRCVICGASERILQYTRNWTPSTKQSIKGRR